jgi:short-subunit dehydrogenase
MQASESAGIRATDLQAELKLIQLNVTSSVHLSKRVVQDMVQRKAGGILFTSSIAGMDDTKIGQSEKDDPAEVAREGLDALMKGKDRVVAGSFKSKVLATTGRLAPASAA